jgi:hypothetical protein
MNAIMTPADQEAREQYTYGYAGSSDIQQHKVSSKVNLNRPVLSLALSSSCITH